MTDAIIATGYTPNENQVIRDLAEHAASRELVELVEGRLAGLVLNAGQHVKEIDIEQYMQGPYRKTGRPLVSDARSFVDYVGRHATPATTVWAHLTDSSASVAAVLDDHEDAVSGSAGWGGHRVVLTAVPTIEWTHWTSKSGRLMSQVEFAEHLEEGADSVREPAAAAMLEIAQSLHAQSGKKIASNARLSGEIEFKFETETTVRAGQRSELHIPETFDLGLAPFEGTDPYKVTARFRYRVTDSGLQVGYRLIGADRVRRSAFQDLVVEIDEGINGVNVTLGTAREFSVPILSGTPWS